MMKKIYYSLADYGSQEIIKVNEVLKKFFNINEWQKCKNF